MGLIQILWICNAFCCPRIMESLATQVNRSNENERLERCAADVTQSGTDGGADQRPARSDAQRAVLRGPLGSVLASSANAQGVAGIDAGATSGCRVEP